MGFRNGKEESKSDAIRKTCQNGETSPIGVIRA